MARFASGEKKERLSTTVTPVTQRRLKYLMEREDLPEVRTPGEAIDYLCSFSVDLRPEVAKPIVDACEKQLDSIEAAMSHLGPDDVLARGDYETQHSQLARVSSAFGLYCSSEDVSEDGVRRSGPPMQRVEMADGSYLVCPADWVLLNAEEAPRYDHCVVIEVRNSGKHTVPHLVYFTVADGLLDEEEEKKARRLARQAWPGFVNVEKREVPLAYGTSGKALNQREHLAAPIVGFYQLQTSDQNALRGQKPVMGAQIYRLRDE